MTTALFDLDGTLTNPYVGISASIVFALERMGKPAPSPDALRRWIGPPLYDSFLEYLGTAVLAERALGLYRERFGEVGLFENDLYPDIVECLQVIAARGTCFVVTSKPRVFAVRIVDYFGLEDHFDGVYGSELDGTLTQKTDLIGHVLDQESLNAEQAVMIGDRRHDIDGARNNGVRSIGVLWGFGSRAELERAGADDICGAVRDLPPLVGGSGQ